MTSSQPRSAARRASAWSLLPERERGGRAVDRHRVLGVADRLELEQHLAEQPAGELAGVGLDLDDRQAVDRVDEGDPAGLHSRAVALSALRLRPAAEQEQRIRGIAAEEVAVDRLEARPPGRLDALVRDVDRLLPPADEVEDRREVRVDPEQLVVVAGILGASAARLAQERDAGLGIVAPAERHAERRRRVDHWRSAVGLARRRDRIASRASRSASENVPSSIRTWASAASDRGPLDGSASGGTSSTARSSAAARPSRSPAARR